MHAWSVHVCTCMKNKSFMCVCNPKMSASSIMCACMKITHNLCTRETQLVLQASSLPFMWACVAQQGWLVMYSCVYVWKTGCARRVFMCSCMNNQEWKPKYMCAACSWMHEWEQNMCTCAHVWNTRYEKQCIVCVMYSCVHVWNTRHEKQCIVCVMYSCVHVWNTGCAHSVFVRREFRGVCMKTKERKPIPCVCRVFMHASIKTKKWEQMYERIVCSCMQLWKRRNESASCVHACIHKTKKWEQMYERVVCSCLSCIHGVHVWKPRLCVSCVHVCMRAKLTVPAVIHATKAGCAQRVFMNARMKQRNENETMCASCVHVRICIQTQGMGTKVCLCRASCVRAWKSLTIHARVKHSDKCCSLPCGD